MKKPTPDKNKVSSKIYFLHIVYMKVQRKELKMMDKKIINVLEKLANKKIVKPGQRHFEYLDCSYEKDKDKKYKTIDGITYECDKDGILTIVVKCDTSKTSNVIIPHGVTEIYDMAFCGSKIEGVTFPSSLKKIGHNAFMGCKQLKFIDFGDGITDIGDDYPTGVFECCEKLEEVSLPSQVKSIGNATFSCCFRLKSVQLNDGLVEIGDKAFNACHELKEITLPCTIDRIGKNALSWVQKINVSRMPKNIVFATTCSEFSLEGMPSFVEISDIHNNVTLLPKTFKNKASQATINTFINNGIRLRDVWDYAIHENESFDLAVRDCIIKKANNEIIPASQEYIEVKKEEVLTYLVKNKMLDDILNLIKTKSLSEESIKFLLDFSDDISISAYVLEEAKKAGLHTDTLTI